METSFIDVTKQDYKERMARIFLFEPLNELASKRQQDNQKQPIDLRSLGLFTLLFFFEMKIMRETKIGSEELTKFLRQMTEEKYDLTDRQLVDLTRLILETFRPAKGKHKTYSFYNWETKQEETMEYVFIKTTEFDVKANRQYYTLADDGLELVFATKEYFQEFQLSIHQLMLRKLLEKGELQGALRQINEMRMDVETIHERMDKLSHEIKRNIVSVETQNRFIQVIADRNYRLQRENAEFEELQQFVSEMKRDMYETKSEKEQQAYNLLLDIEKELAIVHSQHYELLNRSLILKREVLEAAEQSLYFVGIDTFNFDQEITSRIVSAPLPLDAMKGILAPFLSIERKKSWSLLTVFAAQSWSEEDQTTNKTKFEDIALEEKKEAYAKQIRPVYRALVNDMLNHFYPATSWTLKEWIHVLQKENPKLIENRLFYDFFLLCHQRSPIFSDGQWDDEQSLHLLDGVLEELSGRVLTVTELPEKIEATPRFDIQNMQIEIKEGTDFAL